MKKLLKSCSPPYIKSLLKILFIILLVPTSGTSQSKLFLGVVSDLWDEPNNWFPNGVPTANDSVLIAGSSSVEIPPGYVAFARYVEIDDAASLLIDNTLMPLSRAELNVHDSPTHGLVNHGFLSNKGILNISKTVLHGIHNLGIVHNMLLGRILIDSTTSDGISNSDSIHNQGIVEIQNAIGPTSAGLLNFESFLNEGRLIIDRVSQNGLVSGVMFENHDSVIIMNFNQNGTSSYSALDVSSTGTCINQATGVIAISDGGPIGSGIGIRGELVNFGSMIVQNLINAGLSLIVAGASLLNEGFIEVMNVTLAGINLNTLTIYTQTSAGTLLISDVTGDGMVVDLGAEVDLEGEVDIN